MIIYHIILFNLLRYFWINHAVGNHQLSQIKKRRVYTRRSFNKCFKLTTWRERESDIEFIWADNEI